MDEFVPIRASELVAGRPFTDPAHTAEDLSAIHVMAAGLRQILGSLLPGGRRPLLLQVPEPSGRQHRLAISNERPLWARRDLSFVGFFGKKRGGLDDAPLVAADEEMILELPSHPGILSYSSLELADENWANLIMVDPPEAKDHWRTSEKHTYAARELAPRHYSVVRLHNGVFPGGLQSARDPVLLRTKYYDFRDSTPWRGVREPAVI